MHDGYVTATELPGLEKEARTLVETLFRATIARSERPPGLQTVVSTPQDCDSSTLRGDTTEKDEAPLRLKPDLGHFSVVRRSGDRGAVRRHLDKCGHLLEGGQRRGPLPAGRTGRIKRNGRLTLCASCGVSRRWCLDPSLRGPVSRYVLHRCWVRPRVGSEHVGQIQLQGLE